MVLFKENKKELTKNQKRRRLGLRIVLILGLLFCVSLWVLGLMGGPHVALKQGLEDYLTETTGMEATIGEFDGLYFFPVVRFEGSDITFKDNVSDRSVSIGRLEFSSSFWDIFLTRSKLRHFKLENMSVRAGLLSTAPIEIVDASLLDTTPYDKAGLVINGSYGAEPFSLFYEAGYDGRAFYIPDDTAELLSSLGNYELSASGGLRKGGGIGIKIDKFGTSNNHVQGRTVLMKSSGEWSFEFEITNENSKFLVTLLKGKKGISGTIESDAVYVDDFAGEDSMKQVFYQFLNIIYPPVPDEKNDDDIRLPLGLVVDVSVNLKKIILRGTDIGHLSFPLKIKDSILDISDIKGNIMDGAANGRLTLDTQKDPAEFDMVLRVNDLKYGVEKLAGNAVFNADLKGAGNSSRDLKSSLHGDVTFIGGKGTLESRELQIWGGGVVNAMIPDFNPESKTVMNCFIADFSVEDGKATAQPFFLDTNSLTLIGSGTINIPDETINFSLKPKTKDITLIDVAFPVNVKGDLANPSIGPDPLGVGTTLGGLFLGTINPAFFALNVAKLGFTDQHPCSSYSNENIKEVLDEKVQAPQAVAVEPDAIQEEAVDADPAPYNDYNVNE